MWPVSDVHIGSRECDLEGFGEFLKMVEADEDAYLVLCGDIIDNGIRSSLTNPMEAIMPPSMQIETAVELLMPVRERILGVVGGNHEARTRRETDIDAAYQICVLLRIPELYRRDMAFIRVVLRKGNVRDNYTIMLHHGKSEAKKRKLHVEGVDCFVTGHTHSGIVEKPARICFTTANNVVVKPMVRLTATSWLSYGGYGAANMYAPQSTSDPQHLVLEFSGSNSRPGELSVVW